MSASFPPRSNDIEHIESQSMQGVGIVKIFFQPNADIRLATAQVTVHPPRPPSARCRRAPSRH